MTPTHRSHDMTITPTPAEALRAGIDLINGDLTGAEWKRACRDFIKQATAALAAAPQPAVADREALVEAIRAARCEWANDGDGESCPDQAIADALLARGLRLPGGDETMAWAAIGPDGKAEAEAVHFHREIVERDLRDGERVVRVAIRVVEGGDDE